MLRSLLAISLGVSLFALEPVGSQAAAQAGASVQQSGALSGGGTYVLRRNPTAATSAVELWFRAPGAGYDSKYPGISRLALAAIAASRPPHGTSLAELVKGLGGTLSLSVYPDIASIGISVPSWQAARVSHALAAAYFTPSISDEGLKAALRDCAIVGAETRFDTERLLQDALFSHVFASGPAHYPAVPASAADFAKIPAADVKAFAARAFRRQNTVVSIAGAVDEKLLGELQVGSGGAPADPPFDSAPSNRPADVTQDASVEGLGVAWTGPAITDEKSATAMDFIADYLFDADHGTLAVANRKGSTAMVGGQFITLHNPGVLIVTVAGPGANAVRPQVLDAVKKMQQPMDAAAFAAAKNAFEYHIFSQIETPLSRADNFGWYAAEGNLTYAPGNDSGAYLQAAASLDPAYVAQIARTYLQHPSFVQLVNPKRTQGTAI